MGGNVIKGALISFSPTFLGLTPNVIVFQTNPESIVHTWTAAASNQAQDSGGKAGGEQHIPYSPLAVSGDPGETFAFTLFLDANDDVADAATNPLAGGIAALNGVYPRLAALEMLQFPSPATQTVVGQVSAASNAATQGASTQTTQTVHESDVPVALFVWGSQRIVPVRVTALAITEKLYDAALNPSHAEAQITLRVLTYDELNAVQGSMRAISQAAYKLTQGLRQEQALLNLGDSVASIIGMLPTPV